MVVDILNKYQTKVQPILFVLDDQLKSLVNKGFVQGVEQLWTLITLV